MFSNYGPEVDCAAPGVEIYSTWRDNSYRTASGTSASAPFVSGLASLIISKYPELTNDEVMDVIKSTAEDVNSYIYPGEDDFLGSGRINAYNALMFFEQPAPPEPRNTIQNPGLSISGQGTMIQGLGGLLPRIH